MFIPWNHESVRLTGRWSRPQPSDCDTHRYVAPLECAVTTAPGSYFEAAFTGNWAKLLFFMDQAQQPYPHVWVSVDGGARVEASLDRFMRIAAQGEGPHTVRVIYKGGMEQLSRWHLPLVGAAAFRGLEAEGAAALAPDTRPLVEFTGDSITEGVLIDADFADEPVFRYDQRNRPWQDDVCATYAWLAAEEVNVRAMFQAYGATGMTRSGCGGVPRAGEQYPFVFENMPYRGEKPRVVVVNHGTNDRENSAEEFCARYEEYLDLVRRDNPAVQIVCIVPMIGAFRREISAIVERRRTAGEGIRLCDLSGMLPDKPLHPLREGHRAAARRLAPVLSAALRAE